MNPNQENDQPGPPSPAPVPNPTPSPFVASPAGPPPPNPVSPISAGQPSTDDRLREFAQAPGNLPTPQGGLPNFAPKRKRGSKKALGIILAILLVVLGGGYAAYALWYNNPTKVTEDAFRSVLAAKSATYSGKLEFTPADASAAGSNITVDFDGVSDQENTQLNLKFNINIAPFNMNLGSSFISAKTGDLYFKVDNAKSILNMYAGLLGQTEETNPALKKIGDKVDNKWIKVTAADLKEYNSSGDDQQTVCVQKAITDFQANKSQQDQLFKAYSDNRFVHVDKQLGATQISNSISQGYQLGLDGKKAESFGKATEQTDVVKAINKCLGDQVTKSEESAGGASSDFSTTVEVWADQWTHQLTRFKVILNSKSAGSITVSIDPKLNASAKVEVPTSNVTNFKDLKKDFESLLPADTLPIEDDEFDPTLLEDLEGLEDEDIAPLQS